MFERFENRYELRGRLITQTGLHIGAGESLMVVGSNKPVVRDINGLPYIPGSSFKGALRSTVEAMVRALSPDDHQEPRACDPLDRGCICPSQMENWQNEVRNGQITQEQLDKRIWNESCTICRLFGSPWLASKVKVCDLYLNPANERNTKESQEKREKEGVPEWLGRVEVRNGVAIDRDTETAFPRGLYDYETIPRETAFDLHIQVDNATDEELGLLFLGLREFTDGGAWVGGNTSRGLGKVRIEWDEIESIEGRSGLLNYLRTGKGEVKSNPAQVTNFMNGKEQAFLNTLSGGESHV